MPSDEHVRPVRMASDVYEDRLAPKLPKNGLKFLGINPGLEIKCNFSCFMYATLSRNRRYE